MNVFQKMFSKLTPKSAKQKVVNSHATTGNFQSWFGKTFWGIENNTLETNENIFSVVSKLSNTLSSLPFKKYKDWEQQYGPLTDKLMYFPNTNQTLDQIFNVLEVSRNTDGNGYAIIMRNVKGQIDMIVPLNPIYVEPVIEQESKELWYRVTNEGRNYYFFNMDIIHVRHIAGNGNWKGISPIAVLKNSIDFDKAIREFSLSEMESLKDSFVIKYETNVSEELRESVVNSFMDFYRDNGGVLFQEPGVTIERLSRDFIAGDIQIAEDISRDRIANVYNVPSFFLNGGSSSFSSNEQLMQLFVNMTLTPIVKQYEREFNKKVLTEIERNQGYYFKFNLMGLLRGDSAARQAFYHGAIRDGYMSPDEVRGLEEFPPRGGKSDELWISGDMYPQEMDPTLRNSKSTTTNNDTGNANTDDSEGVIEDD